MSFLPRIRQACPPLRTAPATGGLNLPEPAEDTNVVIVSGVVVEQPVQDMSRDGDPVTVLLISFTAPDEKARRAAACCEVEVLDQVAERERKHLRPGCRVVVFGQLTGAGGLWAKAIVTAKSRRRTGR